MKNYPISDIKAPAYFFCGGNCLYFKDNIKVQKVSTLTGIPTSNSIEAATRLDNQVIQIKGSPVAYKNTTGVGGLFHELTLVKGTLLPKISNCYIVARVASGTWVKWAFCPAIHEAIGSITFGANLPMGEHTWTVCPDPLNPTTSLVTSSELQAAPVVPALTDAGAFMLRVLAIYGTGETAIECDTSGASIDISISTEDAENDRLIKYGKTITDIAITAKLKPRNITLADWQTLTGITTTQSIGTINVAGSGKDLVLRGAKSGDAQFTLKSVICKDPAATFSPKDSLMDELSFESKGDAFGDNKLTIGTAEADFTFETESE